jgi:transcriptional regulator with XRE-family HTH domain
MTDEAILERQKEVGERLRQYRAKKKMTQEKFCEYAGITQAKYSLIENGREGLSFSTLIKIIEYFDDMSLDYIFRGSNENSVSYELLQIFSSILKNCPKEKSKFIAATLNHMSQILAL